eukprot:UN26016
MYKLSRAVYDLRLKEKVFEKSLLEGKFSEAIKIKDEIIKDLENYKEIKCLNKLRVRFSDGDSLITENLLGSLADLIEKKVKIPKIQLLGCLKHFRL